MTSLPVIKKCIGCDKEFTAVLVFADFCSGKCEKDYFENIATQALINRNNHNETNVKKS